MKFDSTSQPIIWFRDRYLAGELELKPPFQRLPVWVGKQKCSLVESVLMGLPVPEVYIQHVVEQKDGEDKSKYYVVDGQQRIRTLLQFIGADRTPAEAEWNKFILDKLDPASPFKNAEYKELDDADRNAFLKYRLAVRQLETDDDGVVRDMFRRLNKYLTKLNDQELRNATFTGPFMVLSNKLADDKFWAENSLVTPGLIRRMKDVEFVSELLIGLMHGPQGGSAKIIDDYYAQYEDYEQDFPGQKTLERRFSSTTKVIKELLATDEDSRFRHNRTDFYSLFVALGHVLRTGLLPKNQIAPLRKRLRTFEQNVDSSIADPSVASSEAVAEYARAVEKGANEKARRAERHRVLLSILSKFTREK